MAMILKRTTFPRPAEWAELARCRWERMTTLPSWANADWASSISEPFRSDRDFWSSLAASADALISLAAAIAVGVVLALSGARAWALVPFVVPAVLAGRAALIARASSRRSQAAFPDRRAWRDAERTAVATGFFGAMRRRRRPHHQH
jgi:hypothetical protein